MSEHPRPYPGQELSVGEVAERVRPFVAVVAGVRGRAHPTGVEDDDERPPAHGCGGSIFSDRMSGRNTARSTAGKSCSAA